MCAVDQKRPFFPRAGPFLDLLPFKGPFSLTGALTGPPYGKAPYGEASYRKAGPLQEAPYEEGLSLREGPGSLTGPSQRRTTKTTGGQGPYGSPLRGGTVLTGRADPLREGPGSLTGPSQRRTTKRLTGRQGHYGGPLRRGTVPSQRRTTKRLTGRQGPYGKPLTRRSGPYGKGRSSEKLRGKTLPELGGNFRLCAVDQKMSFFPRVGLFLDFLPFKGPFPLTGALTGRPPYGKAPYGEASYGKAGPLQEAPYEGTVLTGRAGVPYRSFTEKDDEEAYGKAPYGEASFEKAPYELQEKLRGQTLPELGGNFRLCAVDQKRPFFPRAGPFLDLLPFKGPFSLTGALTGPPGPYRKPAYEEGRSLREGPGSLTGPSQRRTTKRLTGGQGPYGSPLRGGTVLTRRAGPLRKGGPLRVLHRDGKPLGPCAYGKASYTLRGPFWAGKPYGEERSLRAGPVLTGRAGILYGAGSLHREERPLITGKLTGSYGDGLYQNWAGISACVP